MKKLCTVLALAASLQMQAQVGIGTTTPDNSSLLEVSSSNKGFLPPRMTATQRAAISTPATGLLVYQTDGTTGYYFYTGAAWTRLATEAEAVPRGTIMAFAGGTVPSGWALCDGSAISRSTHASLYSLITTTYGAGDGSTTFNLPDLRGRVIFGRDNMGGTAANRLTSGGSGINGTALGAAGGAQSKTLSTSEMPSHDHYVNLNTNSSGNHNHSFWDAYFAEHNGGASQLNWYGTGANTDYDNELVGFWTNTQDAGSHTHNVSGATGSAGSGAAFSITNPGLVLNYIIKL